MNDDAFLALQEALAGRWSLDREVGRGGMARIFLGRDVALDRAVAVKVLSPALAADPAVRERFLREARLGARLAHPHIVPVFAVEEVADTACIVMGLVTGESLRARIDREGPVPPDQATRILRELGWALGYAHALGVVHGDVTLDNVLLERETGRAMLIDFGLATEVGHGSGEALFATPAYLAPERIEGAPPSPASDLYALGVVGWTMLAGRLPYAEQEQGAVLLRHLTAPVPPLQRAAPATPPRLAAVIEEAMRKDPARRGASVEAWLACLDDPHPAATADPLHPLATDAPTLRGWYALAAAATALLGLLIFIDDLLLWVARGPLTGVAMVIAPAVLPFLLAGLAHARLLRRRLREFTAHGYAIEDLVAALDRTVARAGATQRRDRPLPVRLLHDVTAVAGLLLLGFAMVGGPLIQTEPDTDLRWLRLMLASPISAWAFTLWWLGLAVAWRLPRTEGPTASGLARFRRAWWRSRPGRALFAALTDGTRADGPPPVTLQRPTELVLDLAIEDLFRALPASYRERLDELPEVARGLRERVAELRDLLTRIDAPGLVPTGELRELRRSVTSGIERGLVALERLRLRLMQLTDATLPTGAVTEELQAGREVEREILHFLGAHPDVERLLRG